VWQVAASQLTASLLLEGDLVSQAERNSLGLTPYSDVTTELAISLLLNANVHQSIFSKYTLCVKICSKETAFPVKRGADIRSPISEVDNSISNQISNGIHGIR
jgi:hypothetical protein